MLEYFKGTGLPSLTLGAEYNSSEIGGELAAWLLEHHKAIDVTPEPKKKPDVQPDPVEVQEEPAQEPVKRARRGRGSVKR